MANAEEPRQHWIPAANNLKTYGQWQLSEVRDIDLLESVIRKAILNNGIEQK